MRFLESLSPMSASPLPLFRSAEPKLRKKYAQILRKEETRRESSPPRRFHSYDMRTALKSERHRSQATYASGTASDKRREKPGKEDEISMLTSANISAVFSDHFPLDISAM